MPSAWDSARVKHAGWVNFGAGVRRRLLRSFCNSAMTRRCAIRWTTAFILVAGVVFLTLPFGQPWTVPSAVRRIERNLNQEDRDWILHNPRETVRANLHMSLGLHIRNEFELWRRNWILRASCGRLHPDDCSGVILDALWQSIRRRASTQTLRALDEHFQRVESARD
jgi:hypothetical protein